MRLEQMCARREYCRYDMKEKALKLLLAESEKTGTGEVVSELRERADEMVGSLVDGGFVSDFRYSAAYARDKASLSGWGPAKIKAALMAKHIERHIIEEALNEIDSHRATSRLHKLLKSKWSTLKDDPRGKQKLIRFALGRGYEYEEIEDILPDIISFWP